MKRLDILERGLQVHGNLMLTTRDAITGQIHEERESDNLITTNGLSSLATAFIAAMTAVQNPLWGGAIPASYGNLSNSYGALGTSSTAATAADLALGKEITRALITNATLVGSGILELDYFIGTAAGNGTITEAGVFTNASYLATDLTSPLAVSTTYTTLSVDPFLIVDANNNATTLPTGSFLILNYGGPTPTTQYCQTTSPTAYGATTINIAAVGGGSFLTNATYVVKTSVVYGPNGTGQPNPTVNGGVLFDHTILGTPVVKTNSETATLGLQLTFASA